MHAPSGRRDILAIDIGEREELIGALLQLGTCGRIRFERGWLEQQTTDWLRLLLLAARLHHAMKMMSAGARHDAATGRDARKRQAAGGRTGALPLVRPPARRRPPSRLP
jgi:hypothetical protein